MPRSNGITWRTGCIIDGGPLPSNVATEASLGEAQERAYLTTPGDINAAGPGTML